MRIAYALTLLLLLPAVPFAGDRVPAPRSAALLLRVRPGVWQPPASFVPAAGLRFEPETGETVPFAAPAQGTAAARPLAGVTVRTLADGSRHAVLGGAVRAWSVLRLDSGGWLEDCVHSEAEAIRRVNSAPSSAPAGTAGAAKPEGR